MGDLAKRKRSILTQILSFQAKHEAIFDGMPFSKQEAPQLWRFFFGDRHGRKESHQLVGLIQLGDLFVPAAIGSSIQRALSELLKTEDRTGPPKGFTIAYTFLP